MGLCNYGNINKEWLPHFKKFYYSKPDGEDFYKKLKQYITDTCGLVFDENKRLAQAAETDDAGLVQQASTLIENEHGSVLTAGQGLFQNQQPESVTVTAEPTGEDNDAASPNHY